MDLWSLRTDMVLVPADPYPLEGAWFASPESDIGCLILHGKGGNFYSGVSRFLSAGLSQAGYNVLALNMRAHDLGYSHPYVESPGMLRHAMDGGAWERISEGHKDLTAAVAFMRQRGVRRVVLVGHSSGGFYSADFADRDPDIAAFVFVSPLLTNRTAIAGWFPTKEEQNVASMRAQSMVVDGRGDDLIPLTLWYKAISATSLLERMAEPPGRFEEAMSATRAPVLMLVGGRESRVADWERMTNQLPSPEKKFVVIDGSEHNFIGFEEQAVDAIAGFLRTHLQ